MRNGKRGKKIHWSAEGLNYSPCGLSTTYYHAVSVTEFGNLEKKERCLTCNNRYNDHMRGFLYADKIYRYKKWLGHKHMTRLGFKRDSIMLNRLVLSCRYAIHYSEPYQKMEVKYIDFNDDLTYIKKSGKWAVDIWLCSGDTYRNNEIVTSPEKIKNLKIFFKLS